MRFSPTIFIALIAPVQAQTTPMTAADAFAAGKSSGDQAAVKSAFDSVTSAKGSEIIPGYSASTPPQSSYWSPSAIIGPVLSGGVAKIAECDGPASSDPKVKNHCEAVQALAKQPSLRPPNLITAYDPLIVKGDAITNNPEAIAGAITGIYSACTTKTESLGKEKQTETCEDYATTGSANCQVGYEVKVDADHLFKCLDSVKVSANASCTVGRLITVDADANYQCTKAEKQHQTLQCNKTAIATVNYVNMGGCTPGTVVGWTNNSIGFDSFDVASVTCLGNGSWRFDWYNYFVYSGITSGVIATYYVTTSADTPGGCYDGGLIRAQCLYCNHTTQIMPITAANVSTVYLLPAACTLYFPALWTMMGLDPTLANYGSLTQTQNMTYVRERQLTVNWDNQCVALESRAL